MTKKYKYDIKQCKKCNTDFRPLKQNQDRCSKECRLDNTNCVICQTDFSYDYMRKRITCTKKCTGLYRRNETKQTKCKNCNVIMEVNINSTPTYCSRNCKDKYQSILNSGKNNPNYGNSKLKDIPRSPEVIQKIKDGVIKSWKNPERLKKHHEARERFKNEFGTYPLEQPHVQRKAKKTWRENAAKGNYNTVTHGKCGKHTSTKTGVTEHYDSSWEKIRMQELDNDVTVKTWTKKHKICVKLNEEGTRWTIPDFLIEYNNGDKIIEEVKGYVSDQAHFELKVKKTKEYVEDNNLTEYRVNFMNHLRK